MQGRLNVRIKNLEKTPRATLEDVSRDWVTIGGLYDKSSTRSSAGGKHYQIWTVGDLNGSSISIFMFGDAFHTHKNMKRGTLLAFLNARLVPARSNASSIALSVQASEQVIDLGKCPDMGTCRSLRRDGTRCTMIVNIRECQYCEYHVNAQYKKVAAGRMDLAGARSSGARKKSSSSKNSAWNSLRDSWDTGRSVGRVRTSTANVVSKYGIVAVPRHQSTGTYEVPGLGATRISGRGNVLQDGGTKASAGNCGTARSAQLFNLAMTRFRGGGLSSKRLKAGISEQLESEKGLRQGLSGMANMLGVGHKKVATAPAAVVSRRRVVKKKKRVHDPVGVALGVPQSALNAKQQVEQKQSQNQDRAEKRRKLNGSIASRPSSLVASSKAASPGSAHTIGTRSHAEVIDLPADVRRSPHIENLHSSSVGWNEHSKVQAPAESHRESQLEASYREEEEQRQRRAHIQAMKKRRLATALKNKDVSFLETGYRSESIRGIPNAQNKRAAHATAVSFGPSVDLSSEAGRTMLEKQSINATLGKTARKKDTVKYLEYLEGQDKMMSKMEKVMSIKTKAVLCRSCNLATFSANAMCLAQNHDLANITATKRFFECQHCGRRETTLNKKFMSTCCAKCGRAAWRQTSMRGGSKRVTKPGAGMQVRGAAHGTEFRGRAY